MEINEQIQRKIDGLIGLSSCNCDNGHIFVGYGGDDNTDPIWDGCPSCVFNGVYEPSLREPTWQDLICAIAKKYGDDRYANFSTNGWIHINHERLPWCDFKKSIFEQTEDFREHLFNLL